MKKNKAPKGLISGELDINFDKFDRANWADAEEYENAAIKALNTYYEYILDRQLTLKELTFSENLVSLLQSWARITENKEVKNDK